MAAKLGGRLITGNSKLTGNSVGVAQIAYRGYDLGKTTGDSTIAVDQDILDVTFQQTGTKPADHIRTGTEWTLAVTFGEISTSLIALLQGGVKTENKRASTDSMRMAPNLYQSMLATESGALKVIAVDSDGSLSTDEEDHMNFYRAIPIVDGDILNFGADSQRSFPVTFRIKPYEFPKPHNYASKWGIGYIGDHTVEDFPPIDWPDVLAPVLQIADATSTTELTLVFSKNIAFQTGANLPAGTVMATVDGSIKIPQLLVSQGTNISTNTLTLKFAANTFAKGNDITLTITEKALKDTASPANEFPGVFGRQVLNRV